MTIQSRRTSTGAPLGSPCGRFQTETKRQGDYSKSRWNAAKWQLRREDIMVCTRERCPYVFCELAVENRPELGAPCIWERTYAYLFLRQISDVLDSGVMRGHRDRHPELVEEYVVCFLLANRASVRLSRATEEIAKTCSTRSGGVLDRRPFMDASLAMRYMAAAHNRVDAVWGQLGKLCDLEVARHREERIRTEMLKQGFWNLEKASPPEIRDAPEWLVEKVDKEYGFADYYARYPPESERFPQTSR